MMKDVPATALEAAEKARKSVEECIEERHSFLVEAGAGAGKTFALVESLRYVIEKEGSLLLKKRQAVACITYTQVARRQIETKIDRHPAVVVATIHSFCWSLIQPFQPQMRGLLSTLSPKWEERITEAGGIGRSTIQYDIGHARITAGVVFLGHNDVIALASKLLEQKKFRRLVAARYPIIYIDEYQDTNKDFADALISHLLADKKSPLIGLFGDHWQKIYGDGCGKVKHSKIREIGKQSNFRSAKSIVSLLNNLRPELPQFPKNEALQGSVTVYHSNAWDGQRRTDNSWQGDLPVELARKTLQDLRTQLIGDGWDFENGKTKILMLTHNSLAREQGYPSLDNVYGTYREMYTKKEDVHVAFLVDEVEPACAAYKDHKYGNMFSLLERRLPTIKFHSDKKKWAASMDKLISLRETASIGEVIDHIVSTGCPVLPSRMLEREESLKISKPEEIATSLSLQHLLDLREVPYKEVIAFQGFLEESTLFSTKHGVKGEEFENVLVVLGRGWNLYNFNQMLEWMNGAVPAGKESSFERNRNLFYVACSRPRVRLVLLFTQELTSNALLALEKLVGAKNIVPLSFAKPE